MTLAGVQDARWDIEQSLYNKLGVPREATYVSQGLQKGIAETLSPNIAGGLSTLATDAINGAEGKLPSLQVATTLSQKVGQELKGLYDRVTNQLTFIRGKSDVSTYIHENGHALKENLLKSADAPLILRLYGDSADVRGHERFARHLEKYFRTGKAPDAKLAPIFESIRGWMPDIYAKTFGGKIDPEVKAIFDI
jgi:hypothetical protein